MALISCPECGKHISDKAEKCVGCGFQIHKNHNHSQIVYHTENHQAGKANDSQGSSLLLWIVGVLIVGFAFVFFLYKTGNLGIKHDYPASVTQNFMNMCATNGGNQEICSCVLDKIQRKYTFEEFTVIEAKMSLGQQMPDEFLGFVAECKQRKNY